MWWHLKAQGTRTDGKYEPGSLRQRSPYPERREPGVCSQLGIQSHVFTPHLIAQLCATQTGAVPARGSVTRRNASGERESFEPLRVFKALAGWWGSGGGNSAQFRESSSWLVLIYTEGSNGSRGGRRAGADCGAGLGVENQAATEAKGKRR